jgi:DNA-directed RNA polymerase sigma subunit (sigma70/sigma32)
MAELKEMEILERLIVERLDEPVEKENIEVLAAKSEELFGCLDDDERRLMGLRLGLDRFSPRPLEAVAEALGLSPEEASRIQEAALQKLRQQGQLSTGS